MKTKLLRAITAVCLLALFQSSDFSQQAADLSGFLTEPRFELPPGVTSAPIRLEWEMNQVLVPVRINGADAGLFQVNSAERESFINAEVAERLGLPEIPEFGPVTRMLQDMGLKQGLLGATNYYRVDRLECGAAVIIDVRLFQTRSLNEFVEGQEKQEKLQMREDFKRKVSGCIGWDLLRTMPFLLDQPGLELVWQSQASPPDGATPLPITERNGVPYVEVTLGNVCKTLARVKISGPGEVAISREFVKLHQDLIWRGPIFKESGWLDPAVLENDDPLPVNFTLWAQTDVGRWLDVECGGLKFTLPSCAVGRERWPITDVETGYGLLRRVLAVFDGPGKTLWIKAAKTTPELTASRNLPSDPSQDFLLRLVMDGILMDDAGAVEILTSPGSPLKWNVPEYDLLQLACRRRSRDASMALLRAGARVEPAKDHTLTPLLSACEIGDAEMIRLLLKKGADVRRVEGGVSALFLVYCSGNEEAVKALADVVSMPADPRERAGLLFNAAAMGGDFQQLRKQIDKLPAGAFAGTDWAAVFGWLLLAGNV